MKETKTCKKGTGKALGFEGCEKQLPKINYGKTNFKYGLGISCGCYSKWLLETKEGQETLKKSQIRGVKKVKEEKKKEDRRKKEENKSIAKLIQEARAPFQKLIRIRDLGKNCICCNKTLPHNIGNYDAGHFYSAEKNSALIFHPNNVHGQLVYCNQYLHGNENEYTMGIKNRIGEQKYNELQDYKKKHHGHKWSRSDIIEIKKHYNKELREVEKGIKTIGEVDFTMGILK